MQQRGLLLGYGEPVIGRSFCPLGGYPLDDSQAVVVATSPDTIVAVHFALAKAPETDV